MRSWLLRLGLVVGLYMAGFLTGANRLELPWSFALVLVLAIGWGFADAKALRS